MDPPPTPLLSDFVLNSLTSLPSKSEKKKKKGKKGKSSVAGSGPLQNQHSSTEIFPTTIVPSKPYPESLLKSAEILQAYFPMYKIDVLADLLEKYEEDIDQAMNALLDSGYSVAEEVILMEETTNQPQTSSKRKNKGQNQQQIIPEQQQQGCSSPGSSGVNDKLRALVLDDDNQNSQHSGTSPTKSNDSDVTLVPDDDWCNLKLPHEFIEKLAKMYGQPDDPIIQAMLQDKSGYQTRLPPALGFAMYRKLTKNAEAKAIKEAKEAAKD